MSRDDQNPDQGDRSIGDPPVGRRRPLRRRHEPPGDGPADAPAGGGRRRPALGDWWAAQGGAALDGAPGAVDGPPLGSPGHARPTLAEWRAARSEGADPVRAPLADRPLDQPGDDPQPGPPSGPFQPLWSPAPDGRPSVHGRHAREAVLPSPSPADARPSAPIIHGPVHLPDLEDEHGGGLDDRRPPRGRAPAPHDDLDDARSRSGAGELEPGGDQLEGAQQAAAGSAALGRSTSLLAAGTFLSRITGFVRVIVAGAVLGVSGLNDAYIIANAIPNIVYDLLLGGILSATLIPVFIDEFRRADPHERDRAISAIFTAAAGALLVLTIALYLLAPVVVHLYLSLNHQKDKVDELAVGISLLHLFAPQVFFLGAIVVSTALLNARRRFGTAAFSPIVNNLVAIGALIVTDLVVPDRNVALFRHDSRGLLVLGLGTTLGYVLQFVVQIPAMLRSGIRLRPVWAPRHPAVRRVVRLSAWLIGVVITNQVSYNIIVAIAAKKSGVLTAYQTAYQFFQLPYALFAVSIASAIMPDLAERWAAQQWTAFLSRVIMGLRVTLALLVPAAVGYAFIAVPVILLTYHHGLVSTASAQEVGQTLAVFALGLPGFSAFLPLVRALQAMKDTRTMFVIYAFENALTIVLTLVLYKRFGDRGLAIAFVAPYSVAAIVTARHLHRKVGALGGVYTARSIARTVLATAVMALVLFGLGRILPGGTGHVVLVLRLVVEVAAAVLSYLLMARWLGIDDLLPVLRPAIAALERVRPQRSAAD